MDLSKQLRTIVWIWLVALACLEQSYAGFLGSRPKRQYGANMYLPASSITPGGEGEPADWSDWSSPSECSRSCGGGVSYQTRECLRITENGTPQCTGGSARYFSCNTQDCPDDEPDFRAQQCARYNRQPFDGVFYDWVPYTNAPNPCELNCMPRGERFYYRQKAKVIDGTRCNDREVDVCVDGQCQAVGCDMMLGSDAKEDKCKKCGGDGTTCKTISDTYQTSNFAKGYNDILLIPSGATNIKIEETEPSNNYLACRNLSSHYYLNGNWRIDFPRPMFFGGCWWNYQRKPNGFAAPDQLTCGGPTTEALYIVMLVQDKTVSLEYEYSIPTSISQNTPDVYTWTHMEFSECSANCGGGTQSRNVTCNNRLTLETVDTSLCDEKTKPVESQKCGEEPCAPHWVEEEWGKCSKGCGADGMQNRSVTCERTSPNGDRKTEEDAVCLQLVGNKPATVQECNRDVKNCPKYHLGPWTPCDKLCGEGKQKRKVTCYIEENGKKSVLPEAECVEEKPETEKTCMLTPCEGVDWIISEWSGCDACGQTVETRTAVCGTKSGDIYDDEFCAPEVPLLKRSCMSKKCDSQWFSSEWSQCSAACGKGVQSRIVICGVFDGSTVTPAADDAKCKAETKPEASQECEGEEKECPGQWFTGPWGACSKECGGGERMREVLCLANGTKALNCDEAKFEPISEKCNTQACTEEDEDLPVSGASTASPVAKTTSKDDQSEEFEGDECDAEDDGEGDDDDDDEGINPNDEVELIDKQALKLQEGVDLDGQTTPASTLLTDDLMLSDQPYSDETTVEDTSTDISTLEGSGEETTISDSSTLSTEGSGDELDSTTDFTSTVTDDSTTEVSTETTDVSSSTAMESSSEATSETNTASSDETTEVLIDSTTDASSSTDISSSTASETSSEAVTESSTTEEQSSSTSSDTSAATESTSELSTESSTTDSTTDSSTDSSTDMSSTTDSSSTSEASSESSSISTTDITSTEELSTTESTTDVDSTTSELLTDDDTTTSGYSTEESTETTETSVGTSSSTETSNETTTETSVSTESTGSTEGTESTVTDSTESSVSTESTSEVSTESTETTEEFSSSSMSSTEEVSTESTSEASTDSTVTEESTTVDIWSSSAVTEDNMESSTAYTLEAVTQSKKSRKCKARKKKDCKTTEFGCCPDKKTIAKGPFDEGCPMPKTCVETEFGCCPDGVSPASGKKNKGCPKSQCAETFFGCCPDKFTPAEGDDNEGCPEPTTLPPTTTVEAEEEEEESTTVAGSTESSSDEPEATTMGLEQSCSFSEFGCCVDGKTPAQGKDFKGCEDEPKDCKQKEHGCCSDGRTAATGPNNEGCAACTESAFGCCPDNETPAHGPLGEGCCLNSPYGCCPDNINSARGDNQEGCDCEYTPYGCCPDKKSAARGPNNQGCSCETSQFGCCPDKLTSAEGPDFQGCPCHTMQYGCCPDGLTFANGPHHYGCHCSQTEFKCCGDEKTPAKGPNQEGCSCVESKFGCCPDGISVAQGDKFEGCENVEKPAQLSCGLPKETGPCSNYSIKYFYDTSYGSCAKFWYGGCEGNDNRFDSDQDCKVTCQEYEGKERCLLPKNAGPCTGYFKKWYFNSEVGRCEEFTYGGCYGTTNRFDSLDECQNTCDQAESLPPCEQPEDAGPCHGNFERWHYDNETDVCRPFTYGGCKGNKNNHPTEHACNYNCRQPGIFKEQCLLAKQTGDCSEQQARWYYDGSAKKCEPFYYTGCNGNKNNFPSLDSCEAHCPKQVVKDICELPAEVGECTNYAAMWYFDVQAKRCRQFYYGGCGGNEHKFATEDACMARCEHKPETTTTPLPVVPTAASSSQICAQTADPGDCSNYEIQWYYNSTYGTCLQFYYGGCGGNGNRFTIERDCLDRCKPVEAAAPEASPQQPASSSSVCESETDAGNCDNYVIKWTFNAKEKRCEQFYYGGCDGNGNRFDTEDACNQQCSATPPPANAQEPARSAEENCLLPVNQGQCSENQVRWYYNSAEGLCDEFVYTGCNGNANNYASEEECQNQCLAVQNTCNLPPVQGRCNETLVRWYYDERAQNCYEFEFTGCRGNRNNFVSQQECQEYCGPRTPQVSPQETPYSICDLPAEAGECSNRTTAWFYDGETMTCIAFTYTGCGGNGNRFATKEQCDRQCGEFRGIDVCREPVETGPCQQWQTRYFYNAATRICDAFTYGGCDGTGNRFTDQAECESVCIVGEEPQTLPNKDICKLPAESGKCKSSENLQERRWYYDDERGACVAFIYMGCSGNQNNFRSYQTCTDFCTSAIKPEVANESSNEVLSGGKCEQQEEACRQLRCPYGMRRVPDKNTGDSCYSCECENPCENYECAQGEQCAIDVGSDAARQFVAVCRPTNKPGECPVMTADNRNCGRECYTDADCGADNKCCSNSCGYVCVRPVQNNVYATPTTVVASATPTTHAPSVIYPGEAMAGLEPKKPHEVDVQTSLGNVAVLRCFATGSPPPNVTWSRQNVLIDTTQGRFVLTSSGDLTIVQVRQTDSGSYVCVATNGLGEPVRREVQLQVTEAQKIPAYIYGDKNVTQIAVLNMPARVRCPAGGQPTPHVTWWRNGGRMGLLSTNHELLPDYSLLFHRIQLSDLGAYTCEAYNAVGRPASMKVVVKAYGPARAVNHEDTPYLQYIIDPVNAPITQRPLFPYRPTRPPVVPPPQQIYIDAPQRGPLENAIARLELDPSANYNVGNVVTLNCEVGGYPAPNVSWTKDGNPLYADERIQITTNPHSLVLNDVRSEDSGRYGCTARNAFSYSTSAKEITIQSSIYVPADCKDSPYYANCQRIVQGNYCNKNSYFPRFCCRSCALAGQISIPLLFPNAV